ncbi:hypothetical protein SSX86_007253 [Deinandra increscens subsp. villosa]|uniref:RING-CH-type domain-containing protein n=1 Tax=Deinandra increscens subsp. villosa TaxID=3103831 RepID=A0AAP0H9H2_9ASTR
MKEEKYQQYVNSLTERIRTCDGILQQVIERQRLVEFAESLRSKLNYFDELENVSLELEPLVRGVFGSFYFVSGLSRFDDNPYLPLPSLHTLIDQHTSLSSLPAIKSPPDNTSISAAQRRTQSPVVIYGSDHDVYDHWCFFDERTKDCAKMNNSGEESDNPIRYPCACSGSIKFVHPDSLLELRL